MTDASDISQQVVDLCYQHGFALAGVAPLEPTKWKQALLDWLAAGRHGEMQYLERNLEPRLDASNLLEGARSVICVADRYSHGQRDRPAPPPDSEQARGRIARYARGDDYHVIMKKRLHAVCDALREWFPSERFRACVDTAPILERELAAAAGLGAIGKHTLLIQPGVGSYLLLGEIITTLQVESTHSGAHLDDICGSCTRCINACPTDAITPWSVDATRCISYLTIEHRSEIDEQFHEPIGDWLFGCDVCQEVCPHSFPTRRTRAQTINDAYAPRRVGFDVLEVLNWSEQDRHDAFSKSSMKRAKLNMMKRNALIVAGNALAREDNSALLKRIESISEDSGEDDLVRSTASAVLRRFRGNG